MSEDEREQQRARWRKWEARLRRKHPERYTAYQRCYRERLKADPERYAAYLDHQRIAGRLRRERNGHPLDEQRRGTARIGPKGLVPAKPIAAVLDAAVARARAGANSRGSTGGREPAVADLLARLGIHERGLRAWRIGERESVTFALADSILSQLEVLWWEAYDPERWPDLYPPEQWPDVVDAASRAWTGESLLAAA